MNRGGYGASRGGYDGGSRGGYGGEGRGGGRGGSRGGSNFQSRGGSNFQSRGGSNFQSRGGGSSSAPQAFGPAGKSVNFNDCLTVDVPSSGESQQLLINSFDVELPKRAVFKYELRFYILRREKEPYDLATTLQKSVEANLRRDCITKLYEILLLRENAAYFHTDQSKDGVFEHVYAYDRASIFFCSVSMENREFDINLTHLNRDMFAHLGRPPRVIARLTMEKPVALTPQAPGDEQTLAQYLDILLTQYQLDEFARFAKYGSKIFDLSTGHDITCAAELKDGHQKSVRVSGNSAKLQLDAKISPFHSVMPLHEYVHAKWGYGPKDNWLGGDIPQTLSELKGIYVQTTHKRNTEVFRIQSVTKLSAGQIIFPYNGGEISVAAYFATVYNFQLEFPQLPCAVKRVRDKDMHYPFECLTVLKGQKIPKDHMNKQQEERMIRASQRLPLTLLAEIENQKQLAGIHDGDVYISPAQIHISDAMNTISAEVLNPPVITYKEGPKEDVPAQMKGFTWMLRDVQFVKPVEISALAIFYQTKWVNQGRANDVAGRIEQQAGRLGMTIHSWKCFPLSEDQIHNREYLERTIAQFHTNFGCDFVMAFASGSEFHHILKATEVVTKVPTQQLEPKTINNDKLGAVTLGGVIQKLNLKYGGYNQYFRQSVPSQMSGENIDLFRSFMDNAMVMGFCLSHPSPGREQPSVCGYAFTTNKRGNISRGGFIYTTPRENILTEADLRKPLEDAAKLYKAENGAYPKRVLIYRFGTSDGEIEKIQSTECTSITDILGAAMDGNNPKLNVIVVRLQHNTRVFKQKNDIDASLRAPDQNVTPGTCTSIPGVIARDTVLVPHRALQGTAKPTIFSNVFPVPEQNDLSDNFLKNITHAFCYMHEIVDSPISVPHALRSAEQMATRGKNLWNARSNLLPPAAPELKYSEATTILNPEIPTRYWA